MRYLRVKNWERFQHQSEGRLPWIKFYTELLEPTRQPEYAELPDVSKCLLHHLWLMASVFKNRIPMDWVTKPKLNLKSRINLEPLLDSGLIQFVEDSSVLTCADARSVLSSSSPLVSQSDPIQFDAEAAFESRWRSYPQRDGRKAAWRHFRASVTDQESLAQFDRALANYLSHLAANTWKTPKNGDTFFNNWADWVDREQSAPAMPIRREVTNDDIRELRRAVSEPEWAREDCSRDEARAYLDAVVVDGELVADCPPIGAWLAMQGAA